MNKSFVSALFVGTLIVGLFIIPAKSIYAENIRGVKLQGAMSSMSAKKIARYRLKFNKKWQAKRSVDVPKKNKIVHKSRKVKSPPLRLRDSTSFSEKKLNAYRAKFRKRQVLNKVSARKVRVPRQRNLNIIATNSLASFIKIPEKALESLKYPSNCIKWSAAQINRKAQLFQDSIFKYSRKYGVESNLVKSIITAESCFKIKALSHKDAQGLMQLIPATAERFGVTDSYIPDQNIRAGTKYLQFLLNRFDGDVRKSIAGYNAGEGAVDKFLYLSPPYSGIPPFKETRKYLKNVLKVYATLKENDERIIIAREKKKKVVHLAKKTNVKNRIRTKSKQPIRLRRSYKPHLVGTRSGVNRFQPRHPRYRNNMLKRRYASTNKNRIGKPGRQGWRQSRQLAPQLFNR